MANKVSSSKREANNRYDTKTYSQVNFRLRKDEDADILQSLTAARKKGITNREWLRELFDRIQK